MMFTPFTWKFSKPHIICLGAQKNGLSEMVLLSTHYTITERLLIGS